MSDIYGLSAALLLLGALLLLWRKKRKFERLNEHGIEVYSSFSKKLTGDGLDSLLLALGSASLAGGALLFIFFDQSIFSWLALFAFIAISNTYRRQL